MRKLLLGHFLYYSGVIDWKTMINALGWQIMQRPRLGELASRLGWLSEEDVLRIMRRRKSLERFGEIAVRTGILNEFQVKVLLLIQRKRQRRIGEYFIETRVLTPQKVEELARKCREHNARVEAERRG